MKRKSYVNFRWVLLATLLPLLLAGVFALTVNVRSLTRYDPAYFTETYVERYDTPGAVAREMEQALQNNDQELMAELQGLRRPATFETSPNIIFVLLWERTDKYISYLYFDMETYHRQTHYVEIVQERWVVTPQDTNYYLRSGRWLEVFIPLLIFWWLLEIVVVLAIWISRASAHMRELMRG